MKDTSSIFKQERMPRVEFMRRLADTDVQEYSYRIVRLSNIEKYNVRRWFDREFPKASPL